MQAFNAYALQLNKVYIIYIYIHLYVHTFIHMHHISACLFEVYVQLKTQQKEVQIHPSEWSSHILKGDLGPTEFVNDRRRQQHCTSKHTNPKP